MVPDHDTFERLIAEAPPRGAATAAGASACADTVAIEGHASPEVPHRRPRTALQPVLRHPPLLVRRVDCARRPEPGKAAIWFRRSDHRRAYPRTYGRTSRAAADWGSPCRASRPVSSSSSTSSPQHLPHHGGFAYDARAPSPASSSRTVSIGSASTSALRLPPFEHSARSPTDLSVMLYARMAVEAPDGGWPTARTSTTLRSTATSSEVRPLPAPQRRARAHLDPGA
jgi:hypothetical protein